jgi:hypothetical protein
MPRGPDLEYVVQNFGEAQKVVELTDQKKNHPETGVKTDADRQLRAISHGFAVNTLPRYNGTPENLHEQEVDAYSAGYQVARQTDYANRFSFKMGDILDNQLPDGTLEKIAITSQEILGASNDGDEREALIKYNKYKGLEDLAEKYAGGAREFEKGEVEIVKRAGERATDLYAQELGEQAAEKERQRQADAQYQQEDKFLIDNAKALESLALKLGHIDVEEDKVEAYVLQALREDVQEAKDKYNELDGGAEFGTAVRNAVKGSFRNLVEPKNPKAYKKAVEILVDAVN